MGLNVCGKCRSNKGRSFESGSVCGEKNDFLIKIKIFNRSHNEAIKMVEKSRTRRKTEKKNNGKTLHC